MNMDGKRFGAGIVGGLLLGFLIIGASGFTFGLFGSFTSASTDQNALATISSSTSSVTSSSTSAVTVSSSTTSSAYKVTGLTAGGSNQTVSSVSSSVSSLTSGSQTSQQPTYGPSAGSAQASASRLESIAAQPVAVDGLILLPVLVALLLGALLYRASVGSKGRSETEPKE